MPTSYATGTHTPANTSESNLSEPNAAGVYQLRIGLGNLVAGDRVVLRVYAKDNASGNVDLAYRQSIDGDELPTCELFYSLPVPTELAESQALRFTIQQTHGTFRAFPWALMSGMGTPTSYASGTQTAVVGTEHFLSSPSAAGVYQLRANLRNMVAGDAVELRAYGKDVTSGTVELAYCRRWKFEDLSLQIVQFSYPIPVELAETNGLRFSLTQTAGTARTFPWNLLSV